jgi:lysyl-tRNA synthetase, class II
MEPRGIPAASMDSGEEALLEVRRQKLEKMRARGQNPFANDVDPGDRTLVSELRTACAAALLDPAELRYDPERVTAGSGDRRYHLFGRVIARRGFGKASFLRLRDLSGEIQLFAKQDVMGPAFSALDDLDLADHVEVRGRAMVTKTGELSIELAELRVLSKAMRPLPDKWHGMTDADLRYRHRYVDFVATPPAAAVIRARGLIVQGLRDFLDRQGFLEVETPTLGTLVGGATARPFTTHHNALDLPLFLRVAPELYLKRLLVGGFERVYEIGRCYRNEGISTRHNPEFTMLELYQAYATYDTLMQLAEELFRHLDRFLDARLLAMGHAEDAARWRAERPFTLAEPFARVPMKQGLLASLERARLGTEVFERLARLAFDTKTKTAVDPAADAWVATWREQSERAKAMDWGNLRRALAACSNDGERLFVAYEYLAEPFLAEDYRSADGTKSLPVFIIDYPAEVSPLARRKDADPTLVDRFELFVDGRELGNAFSELNDPADQEARFRDQVAQKAKGNAEAMDYDSDYILALEHGMPPAAGFGLGVDRLVMALTCQPSIRDAIAFPLMRPEG